MDDKALAFLRRPLELDMKIFQFIENACHYYEKNHEVSRALFVAILFALGFVARDIVTIELDLKIGVPF